MPVGDAGRPYGTPAEENAWDVANELRAENVRLQAQLAAQQAVVDAAVGVLNCVSHGGQEAVWHHQADGACLDVLDKALTALDTAQAAQPEDEHVD